MTLAATKLFRMHVGDNWIAMGMSGAIKFPRFVFLSIIKGSSSGGMVVDKQSRLTANFDQIYMLMNGREIIFFSAGTKLIPLPWREAIRSIWTPSGSVLWDWKILCYHGMHYHGDFETERENRPWLSLIALWNFFGNAITFFIITT